METIKFIFDENGECRIDAHTRDGRGHIANSAEFTKKVADNLGDIKERHAGGDAHHHNVERKTEKA